MNIKRSSFLLSLSVFFVFAVCAGVVSAQTYSWNEPPSGTIPPQGNVDAPINVGSNDQAKAGKLGAQQFCLQGLTGTCITNWSQIVGTNLWATTTRGIYYNGGNVAIGTVPSVHTLYIVSSTGNVEFDLQSGGNAYWALYQQINGTNAGDLRFWNNNIASGDKNLLTLTDEGKVGIGDSSPRAKLSLGSEILQQKLAIYSDPSNFYGFGLRSGYFDFLTSSSTRMTISGAGKVGIGQTAPNYPLDFGIAYGTGSSDPIAKKLAVYANNDGTSFFGLGVFGGGLGLYAGKNSNVGADMVILSSGNVGIGTDAPNSLLQVYDLINFDNVYNNTKIGYQAGKNLVSGGGYNSLFGYKAGYTMNGPINTANWNTAIGYEALYKNTVGGGNTAVGTDAMISNTTGMYNTGLGTDVMVQNTTGAYNVAIGNRALLNNVSGSNNVAVGAAAGLYETGSNAFYVGNVSQTNSTNDKAYSLMYGTFAGAAGTIAGQKLVINGNVGISSTTPNYKLSVNGTVFANDVCVPGRCLSAGGPDSGSSQWVTSTLVTGIYYNIGRVGIGTNNPQARLFVAADGSVYGSDNVAAISAANATTPTKRLDIGYDTTSGVDASYFQSRQVNVGDKNLLLNPHGGNVGVGTTSPVAKLGVAGNIKASGTICDGSNNCIGSAGGISGSGSLNYIPKFTPNGTTLGNSLISDNGAAVSVAGYIGADNGPSALTVNPPAVAEKVGWKMGFWGSGYALGIEGYTMAVKTGQWVQLFDSNPAGTSATNNWLDANSFASFSRINNYFAGNVGIGVTAPAKKLDVAGDIQASGSICDSHGCIGGVSSQWTTSGTSIYYNNGNVGVGTTNPKSKIHISDGSASAITQQAAAYPMMSITGASGALLAFEDVGATTGQRLMRLTYDNGLLSVGSLNDSMTAWTNQYIASFKTNGNVGIGTNNPQTILDLGLGYGAGDAGRKLSLYNDGTSFYGFSIHSGTLGISAGNAAGATDDVTILSNGNVGIGVSNPQSALTIQKSTVAYDAPAMDFFAPTATAGNGYNSGRIYSKFDNTGYTDARITLASPTGSNAWVDVLSVKNGKTGIGTLDPVQKLDINGGLSVNGTVTGTNFPSGVYTDVSGGVGRIMSTAGAGPTTAGALKLVVMAVDTGPYVEALSIVPSGNIGIGVSDPGTYKLNINGNTKIAGTLTIIDANQGANKVLMSDSVGNGSWQTMTEICTGHCGMSGLSFYCVKDRGNCTGIKGSNELRLTCPAGEIAISAEVNTCTSGSGVASRFADNSYEFACNDTMGAEYVTGATMVCIKN